MKKKKQRKAMTGRREFLRALGGGVASVAVAGSFTGEARAQTTAHAGPRARRSKDCGGKKSKDKKQNRPCMLRSDRPIASAGLGSGGDAIAAEMGSKNPV